MTDTASPSARRKHLPSRVILLAATLALLALAAPAHAGSRDPYARYIAEAAQRFALPERWIREVMRVESAGRPRAVSHAGAMGLMQIMPGTWAELRRAHGLGADPFQPRDNILAGAAYLRQMHDRYRSVHLMLAAYNAGPGRTDQHVRAGRRLPAETRAYIAVLVPALNGTPSSETGPIVKLAQADPATGPLFAPVTPPSGLSDAAPTPSERLSPDESRLLTLHRRLEAEARQAPAAAVDPRGRSPVMARNAVTKPATPSPTRVLFAVSRPAGSTP
ncbi:MAG: lytic transglycosylase domain-containing protein [Bosea sp.]|nr:lytic transglycosylase domain-containing protein [Bosea sp. (in: a-proteobacteria)]